MTATSNEVTENLPPTQGRAKIGEDRRDGRMAGEN